MTWIIVLGMHRSGTSCVTRMLGAAGVYLGSELLDAPASDNLLGHWESVTAMRINDAILAASGGSWLDVPATLRSAPDTRQQMRCFIDQLAAHPVAGWKDPRTTLTLPLWEQELGTRPRKLLACLRDPLAVAQSLAVREGWQLEQGLALWLEYNRHLEQLAATHEIVWLDFDSPAIWTGRIRDLCQEHQLNWQAAEQAGFERTLRHHLPSDAPLPAEVKSLYDRLRQRAAATATERPTPAPQPAGQSSPLENIPATVGNVRQAEHRVLQTLDARVRRIEQGLGPRSEETATAEPLLSVVTALRTSVGVQHQELTSVTNWVTEQQQRLGGTLIGLEAMLQETQQRLATVEEQQAELYSLLCKLNTALERNEDWCLYVNTRCDQAAGAIDDSQQRITALEQWFPLRLWCEGTQAFRRFFARHGSNSATAETVALPATAEASPDDNAHEKSQAA